MMNKTKGQITINQYLRNQLGNAPILLQKYTQDKNNNEYLPRNIFKTVKKLIKDYLEGQRGLRIVTIPGLRGSGNVFFYFTKDRHINIKTLRNIIFSLFPNNIF